MVNRLLEVNFGSFEVSWGKGSHASALAKKLTSPTNRRFSFEFIFREQDECLWLLYKICFHWQ